MRTHDQIVAKLLRRPGVRKEVDRIEREEGELLDQLLKARHDAGLTQAQVAERMGTQPPAVARLERALATGRPVELAHLSSSERRVIHVTLSGDDRVTTESSGEGSLRKLVITPKIA